MSVPFSKFNLIAFIVSLCCPTLVWSVIDDETIENYFYKVVNVACNLKMPDECSCEDYIISNITLENFQNGPCFVDVCSCGGNETDTVKLTSLVEFKKEQELVKLWNNEIDVIIRSPLYEYLAWELLEVCSFSNAPTRCTCKSPIGREVSPVTLINMIEARCLPDQCQCETDESTTFRSAPFPKFLLSGPQATQVTNPIEVARDPLEAYFNDVVVDVCNDINGSITYCTCKPLVNRLFDPNYNDFLAAGCRPIWCNCGFEVGYAEVPPAPFHTVVEMPEINPDDIEDLKERFVLTELNKMCEGETPIACTCSNSFDLIHAPFNAQHVDQCNFFRCFCPRQNDFFEAPKFEFETMDESLAPNEDIMRIIEKDKVFDETLVSSSSSFLKSSFASSILFILMSKII